MNAPNSTYRFKYLSSILIVFLPVLLFGQIPENNDPCPTSSNPPIDLTSSGSHQGTTCEATFDYANIDCAAQEGSVWYTFTPNTIDIGYDISLSLPGGSEDAEGPITLEVYNGTVNQGCTGFSTTIASNCNAADVTLKIPNNFSSGQIIYIKVVTSTSTTNCGDFIINVVAASCEEFADLCGDVTATQTLSPITNDDFILDYNCIISCIDYANPDPSANGGCEEFGDYPTVWFKVNVDNDAQQLFTTVETYGNWDAVWSIYGGDDCGALTIIASEGFTCSNDDLTPDLFQIGVETIYSSYWIAVSVDPNSVPITGIDDGTIEFCTATTINGIVCLGSLEADCADESLVFEVTDREVDGSLDGPFCPGEEVTISMSFFYDALETSGDWFSGFIPNFGPGWDMTSFDYSAQAPTGNGMTAQWYQENGSCAAKIQENVSHLCTYYDENGVFKICNLLCEPCSECPTMGMSIDDLLPSGYYWVSNGGNAGCENDCSPHEGWGIGSLTAQIDWIFTLKVKGFDSYEQCFDNNDLQISFQSFSQGVLSCWEDPIGECLIDKKQFGPLWKVNCELPPNVNGQNKEICHGGLANVALTTADGSTNTIVVEVVDNPNVIGEMNHTFNGGSGVIQDNLLNITNDVQIVTYNAITEDMTLPCPGNITEIEVTVYPEVIPSFPPTFLCEGNCIDITPDIIGGSGGPFSYGWSNGENTPIINVCPVVATTYFVTVTDAIGCMGVAEVQVDVKPPVELILPESLEVCKDDEYDSTNPDYILCIDFISGSAPYGITWIAPPGLVGSQSGFSGECFTINETTSSALAGDNDSYLLEVTAVDFFGCEAVTTVDVHITGELTMIVNVADLECGETEATITVTGFDALANSLNTFLLYGGCHDDDLGDFLAIINPSSGTGNFPAVDLLAYTCYTVVGQTEGGCEIIKDVTIPLTEGNPIAITGTSNICAGESATISITNDSLYTSFVWTPDIGSSSSVTFFPDTTAVYFVEAYDIEGCQVQQVFTVIVEEADSPLCANPCENQTSDYLLTGIAYSDDNENGKYDLGETLLSNVLIEDQVTGFTVFTNVFGAYALPFSNPDISIQATISQGLWTNPIIYDDLILEMPCTEGFDFGFIPEGVNTEVNISVNNTIARCDWETKFFITVENLNHDTFDGKVEFTFDDKTSFFISDINGIQVANNTATFETGSLSGFTPTTFIITLKMPSGSSILPHLAFSANLYDGNTLLDSYDYTEQLRCSYDPNDKRTFPDREGDENNTLKDEMLEYTIRFQNNGNDTAFQVRVVDVLDPNIVRSSIRFISASHPFDACLSGDSLIMDFTDIQLIDSTTNYNASQGYISFSCAIDPNIPFDTEIHNTADIIFDTNPPIITNTVLNTVVEKLCTDVNVDMDKLICFGEEFMGFETSGNYQITVPTELGCDSIINLDLTVIEPIPSSLISTTICKGQTFILNGNEFEIDSSGVYEFEIEGPSGCVEELVNISAIVIEPEEKFETFSLCAGDNLTYQGQVYEFDSTGNYEYEIIGAEGCIEQVLNFDITVITPSSNYSELQVCENAIVTFEEEVYEFDSSGVYTFLIEGESGCTELELTFDITVIPTTFSEIDTTICEGQSYEGLVESGVYTIESIDSITGCTIIETISLNVLPLSDPDCITNTSELLKNEIKVYPIPTDNLLFIESEIDVNNTLIISATGKVISQLSDVNAKEAKMDVSTLPPGLHFLIIDTDQGRAIKKVIIGR